ncbi:tRNA (N6-threonylcarbamoyladenosine(37)-N6)-methyltransferase TrmO [Desulfosarcina ovata subsp. sediminis]|uniref:tRNA (N6-threonylcarbamoyladenosine(37)-N6)-methyltransferase TrmO n=1 Tax=Desulfosarcina ovata subsp. sediminis TaxID=885957 RepID=A0A5K7ZVX5_9BACT|nr:tRNA (N6-threonylcarbamoyladenosine(37)-N6)-methyltransferase TrmO [Desulfosarcina ovata]BBO84405.1 tRNA (N6-threonylcarbamoyladenosine(37)-N6)-methyltransferase TrmO [Desulfosarcina ovata subsp. sediminis]
MERRFTFQPIGIIHSCFTEKFGIPRQPGLAPAARATLAVYPPFDRDEAFRGLDRFSHLWVLFVFHGIAAGKWQPTVRPPRLGGNRRMGVFATRSGFRPNPIGMSSVALNGIRRERGHLFLDLSGVDILDGTPVLDIKPYLPYSDRIPEASGGFASQTPQPSLTVEFTDAARQMLARVEQRYPAFATLVGQVLGADPRPAYADARSGRTEYGVRLYDVNVRWTVRSKTIVVHTVEWPADATATQREGLLPSR